MPNISIADPRTQAFNILRTVFPVAALVENSPGELKEQRFYGTAFAIAPGLFLTAGHVIENAKAAGVPVLLGPRSGEDEDPLGAAPIEHAEMWPHDIALLFCGVRDKVTLLDRWLHTRCQALDELRAFGYPHALVNDEDGKRLNVVFRAYKGHVITTRKFWRLKSQPGVYEVCSPFPEGLSGGPVLWQHNGNAYLAGIVIGEETVQYGRIKNRVGIALPVDQFINCESERLGGKRLGHLVTVIGGARGEAPTY